MPNNTLALCKRLKDAGFPQGGKGRWWFKVKKGSIYDTTHCEATIDRDKSIYEPTIIEVEEAVIEEARKKWGVDFGYLEIAIYPNKSCDYGITTKNMDNEVISVDPDRFTAIAELWLKIRGMKDE